MEPTIRQLKYLKALKEEKSFSEAAQKCFVTQSTLSAGIKELETALGHPLVDRTNRSNRLTPLGEETVQTAIHILGQLENLADKAAKEEIAFNGPIRIGLIPTIAPYMIPSILPLLQKHYPKLEPHLHEDMSHILIQKLNDGELDIVILALPYKAEGLTQKELFEESFTALYHQSTDIPSSIKLENIDQSEILLLADGHCMRTHVQEAISHKKQQKTKLPKRNLNATSLATLIQMVNHNYGITLLPAMALKHTELPENVKLVEFKNPKPTRTIGLCWHPKHTKNHEFEDITKTLKHSLQLY